MSARANDPDALLRDSERLRCEIERQRREIDDLRAQLAESQETLQAIRRGEVDALVISAPEGDRIYTLQSAEQPYRVLIEQMREGAITLILDGTIQYANLAFAQMIQRPLEQIIGSAVRDYVAEADLALYDSLMQQCRRGSARGEVGLLAGDGSLVSTYLSLSMLVVNGASSVCMVVTDLTEQKRSEQILASERFARAILHQVAEAIVVCDAQGQITFVNAAALRLGNIEYWGAGLDIGCGVWGTVYDSEGDAIALEKWALSLALRGQVTVGQEVQIVRGDGSHCDIQISVSPLRNADGSIIGAVSTFSDITERKQAELAIQQAKRVAEDANRAKDHFLAVLSHELRTPLTPALTAAQMLEIDRKLPEEMRETMNMVRRNIELEARLIDDLLDLTRIARGKLQLQFQTVDVHQKIQQVADMCRSEVQDKQLRLTLELNAAGHHVRADPARLQQILWNLLRNAVKFTPAGGSIAISTGNDCEDRIMIQMRDTGIGIEPEVLPRLFEPFEQGGWNITSTFGGLGLGLSISRSLVDLHGGTLSARSDGRGKGATFTVQLPTAAITPAILERPVLEGGQPSAGQECRILLVEDHADTAQIMGRLLASLGYKVQIADSVEAGLAAARAGRFDLLISDIGLPDGTGLDLMRQVLSMYRVKGVALSGYGQDEDIRRSREAGFVEHITKPINIQAFEETIRRLIRA